MFQSGAVASSAPVTGSLLLTEIISDCTDPQLSVTVTLSSIGTSLPLGGQSVSELATIPTMTGSSLSCTVTVKPLVARLPAASVAVQVTDVTPLGKAAPLGGEQAITGALHPSVPVTV